LTGCATFVRGHGFRSGSSASPQVTPGDVEPVGEGVSELRIDYGSGYRVYFKKHGREVVILLAGGDKRTQSADIKTALRLARNL
jgi:putative addiction module killer protein